MKTSLEYRSYVVSHDGSAYTASPIDGESFQIRSKTFLKVTRAIDTLWNVLEGKIPMPGWLLLGHDVIDIDAATSEAMLVVDRPTHSAIKVAPVLVPASAVA